VAKRNQRDSLVNPSRACITASVTSSASEICGGESDRRAPRRVLRRHLQQVIDLDIECGCEGVQIGVHEGLRVRRWVRNADLGHPSRVS
jgi:hypothetical protein